ncbi:MAG: sigma-70 family RNA polymerase sigma factor [Bifidobacteriaceae bacterium]|nr:sigma-70 family RNA polymerase sigma factor [Bifidobacteriaceae bacterium]
MTQPGPAAGHGLVEQLFAEHASTVYRYCRLRLEKDDAHDAVSEVFVVALRRWDQIPEARVAWLLGVARRVVANMLRSRRRSIALALKLGFDRGDRVPDVAESVVASDAAYRALARLRAPDREVLLLALSGPLTHMTREPIRRKAARHWVRAPTDPLAQALGPCWKNTS